jgi:hypothetical protein
MNTEIKLNGKTFVPPFNVGDKVYVIDRDYDRSRNESNLLKNASIDFYKVKERITIGESEVSIQFTPTEIDSPMMFYYDDTDGSKSSHWATECFKYKKDAIAEVRRRNSNPHIIYWDEVTGKPKKTTGWMEEQEYNYDTWKIEEDRIVFDRKL